MWGTVQGDHRDNRKATINGHDSYSNAVVIRSELELKLVWIVVDNCIDLPSLTIIRGKCGSVYAYMGRVILESMI